MQAIPRFTALWFTARQLWFTRRHCFTARRLWVAALLLLLLGSLSSTSALAQTNMPGQMGPSGPARASARAGFTSEAAHYAEDDPRIFLRPLQEDAALTDACFVDAQTGWAVGDRGVIWHTADGGQTWSLQNSGVTCRLESVQFVDAQNGWVAGGVYQPYTHTSVGVLLRTRDGGRTWQPDRAALLPALRYIKFFGTHGWAVGDASALFPSGAFTTDDGGRSWTPASGGTLGGWVAADFVDPLEGAMAAQRGSLTAVRRRGLEATRTPDLGLRNIRALRLTPEGKGWLAGDGALVLWSDDLGRSWQLPPGELMQLAGESHDFQTIEARGNHIWVAGTPGSRIFHSADGGQSWQAQPTGQQLPIHKITFADPQTGWAVGSLGTILATRDGGRSWQRQRGGGTRAAMLGIFSRPSDVPLELFAQLAGNDGYLSHVALVNRLDLVLGGEAAALEARTRDALVMVGADGVTTDWRLPLRDPQLPLSAEQLVADWDQLSDGRALERLQAQLVATIRTWRPEVVVTHPADPQGHDALGHLMNQIVLRAVEDASDPTRYPEHASQLGLEAWRVKKVVGSLPEGQAGTLNVTTAQLAPRLGGSLLDVTDVPRGLVSKHYRSAPTSLGFQLLVDAVPQGAGKHDFFSGITLYPGGEARRLLGEPPDRSVEMLRKVAQKHRNMKAILGRSEASGVDGLRLLAQAGDLTTGLDSKSAGDVLYQLVDHYRRNGQWNMAIEVAQKLIAEHGDHPLTPAATLWLAQCYGSSEVAYRMLRPDEPSKPAGPGGSALPGSSLPTPAALLGQVYQPVGGAVVPAAASDPLTLQPLVAPAHAKPNPVRWDHAVEVARMIETRWPQLYCEPAVQYPLAAAMRLRGFPREAEKIYMLQSRTRPRDAWWSCATAEQWLTSAQGESPKPMWQVAATLEKPHLDGKLDDPLWRTARPVTLQSATGEDRRWPAAVVAAYDGEFLFLAGTCRKAPGADYSASSARRPRDPDLSTRDRVEIYLDLDRDWTSWYRLTIDYRGWVAEDCWHDKSWNPRWFVASTSDEESWTFEAAIPLAELTGERPEPRHVWAAGAQRIVPRAGLQSWTHPAAVEVVPEAFGYFVFE